MLTPPNSPQESQAPVPILTAHGASWGQTPFTCRAAPDSALKAAHLGPKTTWLVQPLWPGAGHLPVSSHLENEAAGLLALRLNTIHLWTDLYGTRKGHKDLSKSLALQKLMAPTQHCKANHTCNHARTHTRATRVGAQNAARLAEETDSQTPMGPPLKWKWLSLAHGQPPAPGSVQPWGAGRELLLVRAGLLVRAESH